MRELAIELITLIAIHLPAKSLLRFKSVSKEWYSLITSTYFINLHRSDDKFLVLTNLQGNSSFVERRALDADLTLTAKFSGPEPSDNTTYKSFKVVGSCRGLVVLEHWNHRDVVPGLSMWNPSTNDYMLLPPLHYVHKASYKSCIDPYYGFGYDKSTDDYKLVISYDLYDMEDINELWGIYDGEGFPNTCYQHVYSAKRNSWGSPLVVVDTTYYTLYGYCDHSSVVDDRICYWLFLNIPTLDDTPEVELRGFDLGIEEWVNTEFTLPDSNSGYYLGVLDNCLCLVTSDQVNPSVWVMKEYGVKECWTRLLTLNKSPEFDVCGSPIVYSDGQVLIPGLCDTRFWYNLKDNTIRSTHHSVSSSVTLCAESLVPIPNNAKDGVIGSSVNGGFVKKTVVGLQDLSKKIEIEEETQKLSNCRLD